MPFSSEPVSASQPAVRTFGDLDMTMVGAPRLTVQTPRSLPISISARFPPARASTSSHAKKAWVSLLACAQIISSSRSLVAVMFAWVLAVVVALVVLVAGRPHPVAHSAQSKASRTAQHAAAVAPPARAGWAPVTVVTVTPAPQVVPVLPSSNDAIFAKAADLGAPAAIAKAAPSSPRHEARATIAAPRHTQLRKVPTQVAVKVHARELSASQVMASAL